MTRYRCAKINYFCFIFDYDVITINCFDYDIITINCFDYDAITIIVHNVFLYTLI